MITLSSWLPALGEALAVPIVAVTVFALLVLAEHLVGVWREISQPEAMEAENEETEIKETV